MCVCERVSQSLGFDPLCRGTFSLLYMTGEGTEYKRERGRERERVLCLLLLWSSWALLGPSSPSSSYAAGSIMSCSLRSGECGCASIKVQHAPILWPIPSQAMMGRGVPLFATVGQVSSLVHPCLSIHATVSLHAARAMVGLSVGRACFPCSFTGRVRWARQSPPGRSDRLVGHDCLLA